MKRHSTGFVSSTAAVLFVVAVCVLSGCSKEEKKPRIEEVTGTIERIDLSGRKVVVRTFSQKHDKEITFNVVVNPETEILINGSIAKLEDLKIGETAFGSVRIVEGPNDTKIITAAKVRVERAEVLKAPTSKQGHGKEDHSKDDHTKSDHGKGDHGKHEHGKDKSEDAGHTDDAADGGGE
ncbi:MAG: hypothetical protein GXP29_13860 [Planctomycetes bacterium]|nr:hypothetical protein [Planctomycetota bacterium]